MDRWGKLTLDEKNRLMGIYISRGYTDLAGIIAHYNEFAGGGELGEPKDHPFVRRYSKGQRRAIKLPDGSVGTHLLSYVQDGDKYVVYPNIQPVDYSDPNSPLFNYEDDNWTAYDRAVSNNDTLQFNTEQDARDYIEHYKDFGREGYLLNFPARINLPAPKLKFATGGELDGESVDNTHDVDPGSTTMINIARWLNGNPGSTLSNADTRVRLFDPRLQYYKQVGIDARNKQARIDTDERLNADLSGRNGFWTRIASGLQRAGDPSTSGGAAIVADDANRLEAAGLEDEADRLRGMSARLGMAGLVGAGFLEAPLATAVSLGLGYGVDKGTQLLSGNRYSGWGDMLARNIGGPELLWDFTNPGYFASGLSANRIKHVVGSSLKNLDKAGKWVLINTTGKLAKAKRRYHNMSQFNFTGQIPSMAERINKNQKTLFLQRHGFEQIPGIGVEDFPVYRYVDGNGNIAYFNGSKRVLPVTEPSSAIVTKYETPIQVLSHDGSPITGTVRGEEKTMTGKFRLGNTASTDKFVEYIEPVYYDLDDAALDALMPEHLKTKAFDELYSKMIDGNNAVNTDIDNKILSMMNERKRIIDQLESQGRMPYKQYIPAKAAVDVWKTRQPLSNNPEFNQAIAEELSHAEQLTGVPVVGSTRLIAEDLIPGAPGDMEFIVPRTRFDEVSRKLGFQESGRTSGDTGVTGSSDMVMRGNEYNNADLNIADNTGTISHQLYETQNPEAVERMYSEHALRQAHSADPSNVTRSVDLPLPKTPEQLVDELKANPELATQGVVDNLFKSGKDKHVIRKKAMLANSSEKAIRMSSTAIDHMYKQIKGFEKFTERYPAQKFNNPVENKKILKAIGWDTGDVDVISKNPKMMENIVNDWYIHKAEATRSVNFEPKAGGDSFESIMTATRSYDNGSSAGGGGNMVSSSPAGGYTRNYTSYNATHPYVENPKTASIYDVIDAIEKEKTIFNNQAAVNDAIDKAITDLGLDKIRGHFIGEKSLFTDDVRRLIYSGTLTHEQANNLIDKIAELLKVNGYRGDIYGQGHIPGGGGYYYGNMRKPENVKTSYRNVDSPVHNQPSNPAEFGSGRDVHVSQSQVVEVPSSMNRYMKITKELEEARQLISDAHYKEDNVGISSIKEIKKHLESQAATRRRLLDIQRKKYCKLINTVHFIALSSPFAVAAGVLAALEKKELNNRKMRRLNSPENAIRDLNKLRISEKMAKDKEKYSSSAKGEQKKRLKDENNKK